MPTLKRFNNSGVWEPSPIELKIAELLACGYSQNRAGQIVGYTQQAISVQLRRPEFRNLVVNLTERFLNSGDVVHAQSIALAKLIYFQALTGERERDGTVESAERLLAATEWYQRRGEPRLQFGATPNVPRLPEPRTD